MLVELPDNLAAYEQDAHIYAARQLAAAYAKQDAKQGNPTGAAYWSARLVSGGIGGNMWAHIPQTQPEPGETLTVVYLYATTGNIPKTGMMVTDGRGMMVDYVPGSRIDLRRKYPHILDRATYTEVPTTRAYLAKLEKWTNSEKA
jgi:hypothetical protein